MTLTVDGPRRTETSHFLIKSLELKCHVHIFFTICVILFQNTGRIFIFYYIYIHIYSSYDERIQRKQSAQYRKRRARTVKVTLLPHVVTLCFTYADDDDDLQKGAEDGWVLF